jgi:hypothetical protein
MPLVDPVTMATLPFSALVMGSILSTTRAVGNYPTGSGLIGERNGVSRPHRPLPTLSLPGETRRLFSGLLSRNPLHPNGIDTLKIITIAPEPVFTRRRQMSVGGRILASAIQQEEHGVDGCRSMHANSWTARSTGRHPCHGDVPRGGQPAGSGRRWFPPTVAGNFARNCDIEGRSR